MSVATEEEVEVRCPVTRTYGGTCHPGRLLLKLYRSGERPTYVHPDNLIELYCDDCTKMLRKRGRRRVRRVLHRYDFLGTLIETLVVED